MWRRIVWAAALAGLPILGAGDAALDRATLRGLKSVNVIIDKIDPQLQQEGVTPDLLRKRVEDRLRTGGITVDSNAVEFVGVRILATPPTRKQPYAFSMSVGLYQPVTLNRDKEMKTATQTWETGTVVLAEPKILVSASGDIAEQLAGRFVAAWKSVHP